MKLLNIDDLVKPTRAIVIGGYEHQIAEQSVGQLIDSAKLSAAQQTEGDATVAQFEKFVKTIRDLIPTCNEQIVRGLTIKQMMAIVDFANKPDEEVAQEAVSEKKEQGQEVAQAQ